MDFAAPEIPIDKFEIYANGLDHSECLAFDRDGILWAGGEEGQVYRIAPGGGIETIAAMGGFSAGVAWSPDDSELFVCNPQHGVVRVKRSGEWSVFASYAGAHKIVCANYGVFSRGGHYYVTDSGVWKKQNGYLLKFSSGGGVGEIIAGPFGYANGLALSANERRIFMVESDTDRVYEIDLTTGRSAVYAEAARFPDGLSLDQAGNLYISCYASDDIHRVSPAGVKTLFAYDRWAILLSRPTNIAFRDGYIYAANLGRRSITRAPVGFAGKPLANET